MPRSAPFTLAAAALIALSTAGETLAQGSGGQVAQREPIIQLRFAQDAPALGFVRMEFLAQKGSRYVAERSIVSDDGIERVYVEPTADGLVLDVHFSPEAAARLVDAAREGVGRLQIAVLVKSRLAAAAPIVGPLSTGRRVAIGVELPRNSVDEIAASIAARWPQ
jgi:hypothetical protein